MAQTQTIRFVVIVGTAGKRPKFPRWQGFTGHLVRRDPQAQLAGRQKAEALAIADLDIGKRNLGAVSRPNHFRCGIAVQHRTQHFLGFFVPGQTLQHRF